MINFIDVKVYDNSNPDPNIPSKTSLSISNRTRGNRLGIVGMLPHCAEISFDRQNAQKMIDFCKKIIKDEDEAIAKIVLKSK